MTTPDIAIIQCFVAFAVHPDGRVTAELDPNDVDTDFLVGDTGADVVPAIQAAAEARSITLEVP